MPALGIALGLAWLATTLGAAPQATGKGRPFLVCEAELARLVGPGTSGEGPANATSRPKAPRLLRRAPALDFSSMGDRRGSGTWSGEALIGADGRIRKVWTHRSPAWEPEWPEFDELVAATIRTRVYEPTLVDGSPVPVCIALSLNINWRRD